MKSLTLILAVLGIYSSASQAAYLCDPAEGGFGCIECSDSFCAAGSNDTKYLCFKGIADVQLGNSALALKQIKQEAKIHLNSRADIKAMAESLVNLTVKDVDEIKTLRKRKAKMHVILPDPVPR